MSEADKAMAYRVQKDIFENACKRLKAEDMAWPRDKSLAEMEDESLADWVAEMEDGGWSLSKAAWDERDKSLAEMEDEKKNKNPEDKEMEDKSLGEMEDSDDWEAEARKRELQMDPEAVKAVERKTIKEAE